VLAVATDVLSEIRRAKSEAKASMRAPVERVVVTDIAGRLAALDRAAADVRAAGAVEELVLDEGEAFSVEVRLSF
jgi:valyl-tRNA synthetase